MANDTLKKAIAGLNTGQRFPVLSLVRDDPGLAATLSKLIKAPEEARYGQDGNRETNIPNTQMFKNTSEKIAQSTVDAQTVMQILPDQELASQILVSSILSPKDMVTTELTYNLPEGIMTPEVSGALIGIVKNYFESDYKIKPLLPKMLKDMLFRTGSYPIAVIPENSVDEAINSNGRLSLESISDTVNRDGSMKPLGLLGPAVLKKPTIERATAGLAMEALSDFNPDLGVDGRITLEGMLKTPVDTYLSVTDNHTILKVPQINQKIREQRIKSVVGSKAMESISIDARPNGQNNLNDRRLTSMLYKERQFNFKPITALKTQEQLNRKTVGNPLIMHIPSEAVIPVYVPGCVEEQVGFFILIDADGNPISKATDSDYYQQLSTRMNSNGNFPSAMLSYAKSQMGGFDPNNIEHIDYTVRTYGDMVEKDLLSRLRNGVYGNGVALAKNTEIYRLMFARSLAKQHTQLLFIPAELMTYFAFKHSADGIGQSLLEDMKILNSLRTMLLFANVMASLKNSIGRTEVKLKLDENDPNPGKTVEIAKHEVMRGRQQYFPLGMNSPADMTDWLQKVGFEFTYEGHPGLPDVRIDFGEKNTSYTKPDTELEDSLRKRAIMAVGLSPEVVDASFQAEFATSIVSNNILLSKRVVQTQEQFTPQLADHMRKCVLNSEQVLESLRSTLEENFDKLQLEYTEDGKDVAKKLEEGTASNEEKVTNELEKKQIINKFLNEFVMNFEVALPAPNSVTLENQMLALETYTKALDAALEAWVSDKFFTNETGGEIAGQVNTIKEVIKAYYLRKWMAENGVMTELSALTTVNHDGTPGVDIFEMQQGHLESLTKSLTKLMMGLDKVKGASNTIIDNGLQAGPGAGGGSTSETPSDETGGSPEGGGDSFDLGMSSLDDTGGGTGDGENPEGGPENPEGGSEEDKNKDKDKPEGDSKKPEAPDSSPEP